MSDLPPLRWWAWLLFALIAAAIPLLALWLRR
jgi:hypothetical protein